MFTKAVRMTACDWSVSDVVKTRQNNDIKTLLLIFSFTGIAVSGLILQWKAKELCSDPEFKASLGGGGGPKLEKAPCHELSN